VWEVAGSRHSHGTIVGGVLHQARQLARFSPLKIPSIVNLFRISLCEEAINYRPYVSLSFEVGSHVKKMPFRLLLLLLLFNVVYLNFSVEVSSDELMDGHHTSANERKAEFHHVFKLGEESIHWIDTQEDFSTCIKDISKVWIAFNYLCVEMCSFTHFNI